LLKRLERCCAVMRGLGDGIKAQIFRRLAFGNQFFKTGLDVLIGSILAANGEAKLHSLLGHLISFTDGPLAQWPGQFEIILEQATRKVQYHDPGQAGDKPDAACFHREDTCPGRIRMHPQEG